MIFQALVDGWNAQAQRERAETQMTLGKLMTILEEMSPDTEVVNLRDPHSYRGYYNDLAFKPNEGTRPASELLAECKAAMSQVFEGYKGGDFVMGALTPVWVANHGFTGKKLIAIRAGGIIETADND